MRTGTELRGAFALLERQADDFAASLGRPPGTRPTGLADDLPSVVGSTRADRRRRRWPRVALVAAAVAALAVGITQVRYWSDKGSNQPGGGSAATETLPVQSVPFSLDAQTDATVLRARAVGEYSEMTFVTGDQKFTIQVWPSGRRPYAMMPGVEPVEVRGNPGFYADGTKLAISYPPSGGSPQQTVFSVVAVIWEYAPGAWAQLKPGGSTQVTSPSDRTSRDTLLRVARSIDFQQSTPIRVPFVFAHAPSGMALTAVEVYHHSNGGWSLQVFYAPADDGEMIKISAGSAPPWPQDIAALVTPASGDQFLINQQPAYWSADRHAVAVDAGGGSEFLIEDLPSSDELPRTMAREQLVAIAGDVTFDGTAADLDSWAPATTALPNH